jgi:hypothetical protein
LELASPDSSPAVVGDAVRAALAGSAAARDRAAELGAADPPKRRFTTQMRLAVTPSSGATPARSSWTATPSRVAAAAPPVAPTTPVLDSAGAKYAIVSHRGGMRLVPTPAASVGSARAAVASASLAVRAAPAPLERARAPSASVVVVHNPLSHVNAVVAALGVGALSDDTGVEGLPPPLPRRVTTASSASGGAAPEPAALPSVVVRRGSE